MRGPYTCEFCGEQFRAIHVLVTHRQEQHREEWAKRDGDPFARFDRRAS